VLKKLLLAGLFAVTVSACGNYVTQTEFQAYQDSIAAYQARIKIDGDSVDTWIAATHAWIMFLNDNMNQICPQCGPPAPPPDPPPDGGWQ